MITNNLCQLGLWFAYYRGQMIGHAKDWVLLCGKNRYKVTSYSCIREREGKWVFIDMIKGGLLALLTRFGFRVFNEGGAFWFRLHVYSSKQYQESDQHKVQCTSTCIRL